MPNVIHFGRWNKKLWDEKKSDKDPILQKQILMFVNYWCGMN